MNKVLVTGGTGFIGSHVCLCLLEQDYEVHIVDSLINSSPNVVQKILEIKNLKTKIFEKDIFLHIGDIRDEKFLNQIFSENEFLSVIHLAGLKSVSESTENPLQYWEVNLGGSINLFKIMKKYCCKNLVFSSSATIYGNTDKKLIDENSEIKPINTYGETKASIENLLKNIYDSEEKEWKICNLRYFNPIGNHNSGLIGEKPSYPPNNLFPYLNLVASGIKEKLLIFGNDWPTEDGTGVRDYIHVMDLASGHIAAMKYLMSNKPRILNVNLGTGKGTSVLKLVKTFEEVNKCKIPYEFVSRRTGDVARTVADINLANKIFDWFPERNISDMCIDGWKWKNFGHVSI